jgi:hypothetical protein
MKKVFTSASKMVFLIMAISSSVGLFTGKLSEENFMMLTSGAFAFYFSNKPKNSEGEIIK